MTSAERTLAGGAKLSALCAFAALLLIFPEGALAHGVGSGDARFVAETRGPALLPYAYLGAKHMATGYDHLLYLAAIVIHVRRVRDAIVFATLFSLGHSLTLLLGVLLHTSANSALVDAVIGLSIVYKAIENLGGFRSLLGVSPPVRPGIFIFGLVHGLGLATKLQSLRPSVDGLAGNLVAFNIGVEMGQFFALAAGLLILTPFLPMLRRGPGRLVANGILMFCGLLLAGYHLADYLLEGVPA